MRSHVQQPAVVDPPDASAAGADGHDVQRRERNLVAIDGSVRAGHALSIDDQTGVEARASHIDGDAIRASHHAGIERARCRRGGRPGQHRHRGNSLHFLRRDHAAVRLHDQQLAAKVDGVEFARETGEIIRDDRSDVGIDSGRAHAIIESDRRQHFGGCADITGRKLFAQQLRHSFFVERVQICIQEADSDGLDTFALKSRNDRFE